MNTITQTHPDQPVGVAAARSGAQRQHHPDTQAAGSRFAPPTTIQAPMAQTLQRANNPEVKKDAEPLNPPPQNQGIPASVQTKMESALGVSLNHVQVHPDSTKATDVGALAYAEGSHIHVAPGQYQPNTPAGQRLLGHELTHVAQQMKQTLPPTSSVNGMPVNDDPELEKEADTLGSKAV